MKTTTIGPFMIACIALMPSLLASCASSSVHQADQSDLVRSGTDAAPWCLFSVRKAESNAPSIQLPDEAIWIPVPGQIPTRQPEVDDPPRAWAENLAFRISQSEEKIITVRVTSKYLQTDKTVDLAAVSRELCRVAVPAGQHVLMVGDASLYQGVYSVECSNGMTTLAKDVILIRGKLP